MRRRPGSRSRWPRSPESCWSGLQRPPTHPPPPSGRRPHQRELPTSSSTTSTTCAPRCREASTLWSTCPSCASGWQPGPSTRRPIVAEPSCCPSRSSLMTGRYPHNNGIRLQAQGPQFDLTHSMGCMFQAAGYSTYVDGKFLTTWPKTKRPPCFDHSTVMWGGYTNVATKVDGVSKKSSGYSTTILGVRGREYITSALALGKPFLLYETPQAPHWINVTNADGSVTRRALPDTKYANTPVGSCAGPPETDRSDKPAYVRKQNFRRPTRRSCARASSGDHVRRRRVRRHDAAPLGPRRPREHPGDLQLRQRIHVGRARAHREVRALRPVLARAAVPSVGRAHRGRGDQHDPLRLLHRPDADHARGSRRSPHLPDPRSSTGSRSLALPHGRRSTRSTGRTRPTARPARGRCCAPRP